MFSCVITKLVKCPEDPLALWGPVEETGELVVDSDSEGDCRASLDVPPLLPPTLLAPLCDTDDTLATGEAKRGLPGGLTPVRVRDPV